MPKRRLSYLGYEGRGVLDIPLQDQPIYLGNGVGNWGTAIAQAIAANELWELMRAISHLNDNLVAAITARRPVIDGYLEAKKLADEAKATFGPELIPSPMGYIPNPALIPAFTALKTAQMGISLTARQVVMFTKLDYVFTAISVELTKAGLSSDANAVDQTLAQMRRYLRDTTDTMAVVPEYMATVRRLNSSFDEELKMWGVASNAYGDPRWLQAFQKASDKVVPIPKEAEVGMAGLGNPLPLLILALIVIVSGVVAAIAVLKTISTLIPNQNSKAETARALILAAEERKKAIQTEMIRQGRSQAEINAAIATIDAETKQNVAAIPEPKSPFAGLLIPILGAGAVFVGLKAGGIL